MSDFKYSRLRSLSLSMILLLIVINYQSLIAQVQPISVDLTQKSSLLDPTKLELFLDGYVPEKMDKAYVPGLVVTVVSKGKVLLSKGYGYADIKSKAPMTPQTNIRAGSVSKPVLATAILQLSEQGLIDLQAPISDYIKDLDFEDDFGQASTIEQLLNHEAGYPDVVVKSHSPTIEGWDTLGKVLLEDLPPRTLPPGKVMSYSSWDYALLGYLIEAVTGMRYEDSIQENLFGPLEMNDSTYSQPVPQKINSNLANGYFYTEGNFQVVPHDFVRMSPGVALVTNGEDMGRYMMALLNGGGLEGNQVLESNSMSMVFERQASAHPYSRGRSYVFPETTIANRKAFYHDGNGIGFNSRMVLIPQHDLGIFMSINHRVLDRSLMLTKAARMMRGLNLEIVKRLTPESEPYIPAVQPLTVKKEQLERFAGNYHVAQISPVDLLKAQVFVDNLDVSSNSDGSLRIGSRDYIAVEPLLFQSVKNPGFFVVFVENNSGDVEYLTFGGTGSYKRSKWYQNPIFSIALVGITTLLFISMLVVWPFKRHGHWLLFVVSCLYLMFIVGVALLFTGFADLMVFFKTIPLQVQLLFSIPWITLILASVGLFITVKQWRNNALALWGKTHYISIFLASLALFGFANYWNFILK